ncbi:hypothetical protein V5O48_009285 [Marasmius crinis-equi]|uniref:NmrA-like domain-containing protein n=1 Tax=Marasmius crinis-equi TaxID=585013 RepID=A0ABR3FBM1_9AGAR
MTDPTTSNRTILVTGATGRQGKAVVEELVASNLEGRSHPFKILALTRNNKQPLARKLAKDYPDHVIVVEGDLDDVESIRRVFETEKEKGKGAEGSGIWGVFCVLAFPGLGVKADTEEKQGKCLADISLEFGVSHFIYSSAEGASDEPGQGKSTMDDSIAKTRIERHVKELGDKGLSWTILHPGIFMENYEGFMGSISFGVFKAGLQPTTQLFMTAVQDIGRVAAGVFKHPSLFTSQTLLVAGEACTIPQQETAYLEATGQIIPSIPSFLARTILMINGQVRDLVNDMERISASRKLVGSESAHDDATRRANPDMMSFGDWCRAARARRTPERNPNWNGVSLRRLVLG